MKIPILATLAHTERVLSAARARQLKLPEKTSAKRGNHRNGARSNTMPNDEGLVRVAAQAATRRGRESVIFKMDWQIAVSRTVLRCVGSGARSDLFPQKCDIARPDTSRESACLAVMKIPERQRPRFKRAIERAANFISNTSTQSAWKQWPFYDNPRNGWQTGAERIDIEIWAGQAF